MMAAFRIFKTRAKVVAFTRYSCRSESFLGRLNTYEIDKLTTWQPLSAKVGTTLPTSGGRSVGIVRSRTKATEFSSVLVYKVRILDNAFENLQITVYGGPKGKVITHHENLREWRSTYTSVNLGTRWR
jgi:hypothetical protein